MLSAAVTPESTLRSKTPFDPALLQDAVPLLKQRQKECIAEGKFLEAEALKHRVAELLVKQRQVELTQLKSRQASERVTVEAAHMDDYREFNARWDESLAKYTRESEAQMGDLKATHETQRRSKLAELEETTPNEAKLSSAVLNMKKKLQAYLKSEMFAEAHELRQQIEAKEAEEFVDWAHQRSLQIQKKMKFFEDKKLIEVRALKSKLKKGYDELTRRRAAEMEIVIKRYQNNAKQLSVSQGIEKNKRDGRHTTSAGRTSLEVTSISRILASSRSTTPGVVYRPKLRSKPQ